LGIRIACSAMLLVKSTRIREETQDVLTIFTQASQQIGRSGLTPVRGAILAFLDWMDCVAFS
jgi:hypothetical protein